MKFYKNGVLVNEYVQSYGGHSILIAIDSSKSNSALVVSDEYGNILDDYEISGAGSDTDVYDLCAETRRQVKSLFQGANILLVGIEDIITKKEKGYKGIEIHQSRAKITAVFNNFIFLFEEFFNIRPTLVNNWTWKSTILPEEYRKREHDKGSYDWFNDLGNRWSGRKDDVTDVVCIMWYLLKTHEIKPVYTLKETSPAHKPYTVEILPICADVKNLHGIKEFVVDNKDSLMHNLDTISNNISSDQRGILRASIEDIPIEWIYSDRLKYSNELSYGKDDKDAYLIVSLSKDLGS